MAVQQLGSLQSERSDSDVISLELRRIEIARRNVADKLSDVSAALAQADRDQLTRDIADIERATAVLRRTEPALQTWTRPQPTAARRPRPIWLLIGVLWFGTALIAAAAVVAIAALAG